jgi:tetratricopeptide (TPR) repeat protein
LKARDFYLKAIDAEPKSDETVFRRLRAGGQFQLGTAYQGLAEEFPADARNYRGLAAEDYERAIALYPEYEAPRINLAVTLIDSGEYSRAIQQCQAILDVNPDSAAAYRNWGMAYYEQGELGEALERYQRSLEIEPENAGAMASAGGILAQMGRVDEGVEMLHRALGIDPKNEIARQNLGAAMRLKTQTQP